MAYNFDLNFSYLIIYIYYELKSFYFFIFHLRRFLESKFITMLSMIRWNTFSIIFENNNVLDVHCDLVVTFSLLGQVLVKSDFYSVPIKDNEGFIDQSYNNWMVYLKNENGEYKRGLFRRMASMKFKPNEIKNIFKLWLEFEENRHGNVGEIQRLAQEYVNKQQDTQ